jgi:hypothetical protein
MTCCDSDQAECTLQDEAESFWRHMLPGLSASLLTRLAFYFQTTRCATASAGKRELIKEINAELKREAFVETQFGDLVFTD